MRTNGTLQYQILEQVAVTTVGEPIASQSQWSDAIACHVKTNSDNRIGKYEDGEFRVASFIVLLEADAKLMLDSIKRVKLTRYSEVLGEYRVVSVEPVLTQGRIQITV